MKTSSPAELDLEFHDLYVVDRIGSKLSYSSDKSFLADMNDLYRPPKYVPSRAVPLAFDEEKSRPDACWNCGDRNHKLGDCQHPIMDQDIIELNRAIFNVIHHAKSDSGVRFQSAHSSGKLRTEKRELEPRSGQYLHARRSAHSKRARYGASEGNLTTGLYHPSRAVGYYPYPHPPF